MAQKDNKEKKRFDKVSQPRVAIINELAKALKNCSSIETLNDLNAKYTDRYSKLLAKMKKNKVFKDFNKAGFGNYATEITRLDGQVATLIAAKKIVLTARLAKRNSSVANNNIPKAGSPENDAVAPAVDTTTAPAVDTTTAPAADTTTAPAADTTTAPAADTTTAPVADTTTAPAADTTTAPAADTTTAPAADTTTAPAADTTTAPAADTTTAPAADNTAPTGSVEITSSTPAAELHGPRVVNKERNQQLATVRTQLAILQSKIEYFDKQHNDTKDNKYLKARKAVHNIVSDIEQLNTKYETNQLSLKDYKTQVNDLLDESKSTNVKTLSTHRGWKEFFFNAVAAVVGSILYLVAAIYKGSFSIFQVPTDAEYKIRGVRKELGKLEEIVAAAQREETVAAAQEEETVTAAQEEETGSTMSMS